MSPAELQNYLHDRIPLARAMEIQVDGVGDDEVVLTVPLEPNRNHRGTLFGGSAAAAATCAAWGLLAARLGDTRLSDSLMIQRSGVRYNLPVTKRCQVRSRLESPQNWERFIDAMKRRRRARITVKASLEQDGVEAVGFTATFIAVPPREGRDRNTMMDRQGTNG